jgi:probable H4MPT-linked C1 transfer pathway protein
MASKILGLDIGGANLKAAHSAGPALTRPFAVWKQPNLLPVALHDLLRSLPAADRLAVTMTGELCDCFASKRAGVLAILDAVAAVADGRPVSVWLNDGRLVSLEQARSVPLQAAAANWLALATFVGRFVPAGAALLIDTGSTTTDIIPLLDSRPAPMGWTDPERLRSRELVYTGAQRTPVCALLGGVGAAEFFATMQDVYLVLGDLPEQPESTATADGRPATRPHSHDRLARMLCADGESSTEAERLELARLVGQRQVELLADAIRTVAARLPGPPAAVVLAGSGAFVAQRAWEFVASGPGRVIHLGQLLGPDRSEAACAYALAVLSGE